MLCASGLREFSTLAAGPDESPSDFGNSVIACVGVDSDASMLEQAQLADPEIEWVLADLATVTPSISRYAIRSM